MCNIPERHVHLLSPLSHLLSLVMSPSRLDALTSDPLYWKLEADCDRFFQQRADRDGVPRLTGGRAEVRRRLFDSCTGEAPIDDETEAAKEEVFNARIGSLRFSHHRFVQERIFDGRNGREAYMDAMQRRSEEMEAEERQPRLSAEASVQPGRQKQQRRE